eukprot:4470380-Pleurochrysis_carterae.AAC.1
MPDEAGGASRVRRRSAEGCAIAVFGDKAIKLRIEGCAWRAGMADARHGAQRCGSRGCSWSEMRLLRLQLVGDAALEVTAGRRCGY